MWCEKVEKVTCRATARIFIVAYAQTDSPEGRTGPAARSDVYDCPIHHHHHYHRRRRRRIAREGRSRRCTTMSTVDSTPPQVSSRTVGIVS